jgi:hypothetical protein
MRKISAIVFDAVFFSFVYWAVYGATSSAFLGVLGILFAGCYSVWCFYDGKTR